MGICGVRRDDEDMARTRKIGLASTMPTSLAGVC